MAAASSRSAKQRANPSSVSSNQYPNMTKTQILGKSKRRDGCGNLKEVAPTMPDDDYDWADDDALNAEDTMRTFEALGPDVEITGPPEGAGIPPHFRQTASLTSAY